VREIPHVLLGRKVKYDPYVADEWLRRQQPRWEGWQDWQVRHMREVGKMTPGQKTKALREQHMAIAAGAGADGGVAQWRKAGWGTAEVVEGDPYGHDSTPPQQETRGSNGHA